MQLTTSTTTTTLLAAIAAAVSLAACDRPNEGRTLGQRAEGVMASAERKAEELRADASRAGERAAEAAGKAADVVVDKARDAAITTSVNAELAKDPKLSALRIDVDTSDGRVALKGTALDAETRERATRLAMNVHGVRSVDNELQIRQ